jgi:hypothetical protein
MLAIGKYDTGFGFERKALVDTSHISGHVHNLSRSSHTHCHTSQRRVVNLHLPGAAYPD